MTEKFTRQEFEDALPTVAGQALWTHVGLVAGEHCYIIPVRPGVLIFVRSSVNASGVVASNGEDSIRCLIVDEKQRNLGSKDKRWIARTSGWRRNLTELLRKLWRIAHQLEPCKKCGAQTVALKVRDPEAENVGRWFLKCPACGIPRPSVWLTEKEAPEK